MASRTPLYDWHRSAGARSIEFGGWEMPLQYSGIVEEHLTVRKSVGLFDVSHMGKIFVEGSASHDFLDHLSANEISSVPGRSRYTHLLRDDGTIIDDVIVTCLAPDRFFLVCNAGPRADVVSWLKNRMIDGVRFEDRTLEFLCLAVQGPRAPELLQRFTSVDLSRMKPFSGAVLDFVPPAPWGAAPRAVPPEIEGWGRTPATDPSMPPAREPTVSDGRTAFLATRTGYTGEPGFELFPTAVEGLGAWEAVLKSGEDLGIRPIGLGARDTLRLEKGYLLSGQDFTGTETSLETNSEWLVKWDHAFIGREALLAQKARGGYRLLMGLRLLEKGVPRHGCRALSGGREVGLVTSGTLSPSLRVGIALATLDPGFQAPGTRVAVDIRGEPKAAEVVKPPFL